MKENAYAPGSKYVLDSFALLALLNKEAGGEIVCSILEYGQGNAGALFLSAANLCECLYCVERAKGNGVMKRVHEHLRALPIAIVPVDEERAVAAARIKARHRMSLADACAAALAMEKAATVVTGDPEFKEVEAIVPVFWLPNKQKVHD